MKKNNYRAPEIKIIELTATDIIRTSGEADIDLLDPQSALKATVTLDSVKTGTSATFNITQ